MMIQQDAVMMIVVVGFVIVALRFTIFEHAGHCMHYFGEHRGMVQISTTKHGLGLGDEPIYKYYNGECCHEGCGHKDWYDLSYCSDVP